MIPVSLRLSGFLSYLDLAELDFTSFDLACISGANGAGKSSLLDAMTWALFGQARRRDDALINSSAARQGKSAEVVFIFDYEGRRYRIQRAKQPDKSAILEFYVQNEQGGWNTLSERSLRETETRIQQILRLDYETFTNASFFLQGKADQFAQQRPGDRKRILSSILGLELWDLYRDGAINRRKASELDLSVLDSRLAEIDAELGQEDERRARLSQLEDTLAQQEKLRQAREDSLDGLHRLQMTLAEQRRLLELLQRQWQAAIQRQEQRAARLQARQAERQAYLDQLSAEDEVRAAHLRWQADRRELERWDALAASFRQQESQRAGPLMAIEKERATLAQERAQLLVQQAQAAGLEFQKQQAQADLHRLQADEIAAHAAYARWQETRQQLATLNELAEAFRKLDTRRTPLLMALDRARTTLQQEKTNLLAQQRQAAELDRQRATFAQAYSEAQSLLGHLKARLEKRQPLEVELRNLQEKRIRLKAENERLVVETKLMKERITRLEEASGALCPLCGQPLSPQERQSLIDSISAQGKEMKEVHTSNDLEMRSADQAVRLLEVELVGLRQLEQTEYQGQNRRAAGLEERLAQIESGLETWGKNGALRLVEVERVLANEDFAPGLRSDLASLEAEMAALAYDPAAHEAVRSAEQVGQASEELLRQLNRQAATDEQKLKQIQSALDAWTSGPAARLAELERILAEEDFAHQARAELAAVDQLLRSLGYDPAAHDAVRRAELDGRQTEERLRQMESLRAALEAMQRELAELDAQCQAGEEEVGVQELAFRQAELKLQASAADLPDIDQVEREVFDLKEQESRLKMQVGGARQQVEVLKPLEMCRSDLQQRRVALTVLIGRYKQLEKAFGKDGVPALLIEQALPELETQANEILDQLSAGEMSVRFATQKDYRDRSREDKKETLDILISDASGTREYEMFSGGEAFRVNFAIRLALSRLLAQRAGARLQTLVIDEGFGSQDSEGRQRLIEAINLVRPDFAKVLVITHLEELKDAFPARIEVEKTPRGSQVRVV